MNAGRLITLTCQSFVIRIIISNGVLNIVDCFSKKAWSFPCKKKDSVEVVRHLRSLFEQGHVPTMLQSDNAFDMNDLKNLCAQYGVKQILSSSYYAKANG